MQSNRTLTLSEEEMRAYGYKVVDTIVNHFKNQHKKDPVFNASRQEMDSLFLEQAPEEGKNSSEVLDFVIDNVLEATDILSHPKSYSFVPGPSKGCGRSGAIRRSRHAGVRLGYPRYAGRRC